MSRIGTIARRTFLIGSAAIAGGVAFGIYAVRKPHANPLLADLGDGEATFNPWVKVSSEGITLITPHADKGQGVMSVQAALIAEEMDLEWGQFETTFGTPSAAYYNTGMADEAVPFMSTDDGRIAETMRTAVGGVMKLVGMQGTGGSTSVPDTFEKLRMAGAVARETLKLAAAQANGLDASDLTTEAGSVVLPDGTRLAYTELAGAAAGIEPVQDVALRDPSDWRILGKPMERLDILAKSTGAPIYGIDKKIDGMVHAAIRVNPRQGGAINGFDASAAEAMRGVQAIVPITGGVAVVADNTWRAMQAVNAIEIDWGAAPYPDNQDAHWEALANAFDAERLDKEWRNDGAIEDALGVSEVIEATYRSPYVAHAPLEPLNAIVQVHDDAVDVWTGHQMPQFLQQAVGRITGHDPDQVRFHNAFMGGSFGHRLELEYIKQATEIAMTMRGTPVKLTYSREEDFAHDYPRHISMGVARGRVADGRVEAIDLHIA